MERNKILLVGKKVIKGLLVSSIVLVSAQADFLMTLTDKNGVEENLCVKSYSFSNNLESLHKEVKQMKDVYSTEETLTNKIYMGKPVYRKVVLLNSPNIVGTWVNSNKTISDIDKVINYNVIFSDSVLQQHTIDGNGLSVRIANNVVGIHNNLSWANNRNLRILFEYTKTTDTAQTDTNELTTLVHYLPSNSTTGEYITKSMDDATVGFKKNYTYDASTNSCIAPAN